jgi:GT2 family glycosyltransferase
MDISVVIVGWNAKQYLELCLASLADATPRRSTETIVVDNASSDGTAEMIEARFPNNRLIRNSENFGFSKGSNVGIRESQGRYIALVNPDVIVLPGCLDALADFLDQNPKVGNVGPRIFNPDMSQQNTCQRFPTLWNNFCSATGLARAFKRSRFFAGEEMLYFPHDRTLPVDVLVGCFSMIRRDTFDDVGLLDEKLFMYSDDLDWCRRCWKAGWQVVFFPGASSIHDRGNIAAPYPVRFAVVRQQSMLYYWRKHHTFWGTIGIRSIMILRHLIRYAFFTAMCLARSNRSTESKVRKKMSGACILALLSHHV